MQQFFKITTFKVVITLVIVAAHAGGNLLYNRSLYSVSGKLFSNADIATQILYYAPNVIVAPLQPFKNLFVGVESSLQIPLSFPLYLVLYLSYLYTVSCGIAWSIKKYKKMEANKTR